MLWRGVFEALKFAGISEQAEMSTLGQQVCKFGCLVQFVRLFLMQPCASFVYLPFSPVDAHSYSFY